MTPREEIADLYRRFPQKNTFDSDERIHRITGIVLEGDDYFFMGRGVNSKASQELITNPAVCFPRSRQDMWFVFAYAGPLCKIYEIRPYDLPLVGWVRRGTLRIYGLLDIFVRCEARRLLLLSEGSAIPAEGSAR